MEPLIEFRLEVGAYVPGDDVPPMRAFKEGWAYVPRVNDSLQFDDQGAAAVVQSVAWTSDGCAVVEVTMYRALPIDVHNATRWGFAPIEDEESTP